MSRGLKIVMMAVSILITIGMLTYSIVQYHSSSDAVEANRHALTDATIEWGNADIQSLLSSDRTGAEVLNAVRKYKSDYPVKVVTNLSGEEGKTYTASDAVVNDDKDSANYVNPQSIFHCDVITNANGVITTIVFTEDVKDIVEDSSIETPNEAKQYLVNELGGLISMSDSWATIASTLKNNNDQSAKRVLAGAVNGDLTESWYSLASKSATRISELEDTVSKLNENASTQHTSGSLSGDASVELAFTPSMVIVWDSHNNMQMYKDSVWTTRNTGSSFETVWCNLISNGSTSVLTNSSTQVLQYEAYSY